jgi:uncharacterized protein (DUF362 family)
MSQINIIYGVDIFSMTQELLRLSLVDQLLRGDMRVVIKPNLVVAKSSNEGATTHSEIIDGIICFLKEFGVAEIIIAEGSWLGESTERAISTCGYDVLSKRYGVRIVDTKKNKIIKKTAHGLELGICSIFFENDFFINVPVLKGHCQTRVTCCLKNLKGCIPDSEKRRYHNIGLHEPIAALNTILKPDIHIIDGICGDPTFEEGGNPVTANRILCGFDPVELDSYCANLLGFSPEEIEYICLANKYGVGNLYNKTTKIYEYRTENRTKITMNQSENQSSLVRELSSLIDENNACSACYAALIFALNKIGIRELRKKISEPIKIGQGFRGTRSTGLGIGDCTKSCTKNISGCPPTALDVIHGLKQI